jgi:hypothetical protein
MTRERKITALRDQERVVLFSGMVNESVGMRYTGDL